MTYDPVMSDHIRIPITAPRETGDGTRYVVIDSYATVTAETK
jgi:hypothetical protein